LQRPVDPAIMLQTSYKQRQRDCARPAIFGYAAVIRIAGESDSFFSRHEFHHDNLIGTPLSLEHGRRLVGGKNLAVKVSENFTELRLVSPVHRLVDELQQRDQVGRHQILPLHKIKYLSIMRRPTFQGLSVITARTTRIYHWLQIAAHRARVVSDHNLAQIVGLTTAQVSVLSVLSAAGFASQVEVAGALKLRDAAITPMVARLLDKGLIARQRDDSDRRSWRLNLTDAGKSALQAAQRPFARINRIVDSTLSEEEISHLAILLAKVVEAFDQEGAAVEDDNSEGHEACLLA